MSKSLDDYEPSQASEELIRRRKARNSLAEYIEYVSGKTPARHMRFLCDRLEKMSDGKISRLLICEPPGHAKSFITSWHFPAYYLAKHPDHSVITVSHTESFAEQWGRRVRNLMLSDEHKLLFPNVSISEDSRAAGRWETTAGGTYYATGVGGAVTGRRANLVLIDDPLRGIEDAESATVRENMYGWYAADLSTRLFANGVVCLIQTRWHLDDLAGRLIAAEGMGGDKWDKLILPAIAKENDPLGRKVGEALWPEFQPLSSLERIRAQPSMTPRIFESLFQQSPVAESGNLIQRDWFKYWRSKDPPSVKYVLQSWDTAVTRNDKSAWSVCTTWGIFDEPETNSPAMILLSMWRGKLEYPELKKMARRLSWNYHDDRHDMPMHNPAKMQPDTILIERKSSGIELIQDFTRAGIAVVGYNPNKDGSKEQRLLLSLDFFENGRIWVPAAPPAYTMARKWAQNFIDICVSHPANDSRDVIDSVSQAIIRIKRSGWVHHTDDPVHEAPYRNTVREAIY